MRKCFRCESRSRMTVKKDVQTLPEHQASQGRPDAVGLVWHVSNRLAMAQRRRALQGRVH